MFSLHEKELRSLLITFQLLEINKNRIVFIYCLKNLLQKGGIKSELRSLYTVISLIRRGALTTRVIISVVAVASREKLPLILEIFST